MAIHILLQFNRYDRGLSVITVVTDNDLRKFNWQRSIGGVCDVYGVLLIHPHTEGIADDIVVLPA